MSPAAPAHASGSSDAVAGAAAAPGTGAHQPALRRVLRPLHLWAIAVGLVISGDYFGWNYGLAKAGPIGMLLAVLVVTAMYVFFIFSYTELSTAIPHSGGPYAYARRALGVAMSAEEVVDPKRDIPRGYIAGLITLVALALGTLVCTSGVLPVSELVKDDSPLPRAMAAVLSQGHWLTHMMIYIGLFGLLASFHGIMMGYSRQVYALARGGYLPPFLAYLHPRRRTPIWAVVAPGLLGLGVVLTGKTALAIGISTLGATILYITSMVSLLVLRRREPELARPFRAPGYPFVPIAALLLAGVCMAAIVASEPILGAVALASMSAFLLYYLAVARERVRATRDEIPTL